MNKTIIAVIPAYNEATRIKHVIEATSKYVNSIIVVNDCSKDDTSEAARSAGTMVIDLPENRGAGYATRTGCEKAIEKGADILITIDADGQHDPDDIPHLVKLLHDERLDIVFGARPRNQNMPLIKKTGNKLLSFLSYIFFKIKVEDTLTGLHVFTKACYPKLKWETDRYAFVIEMVYRVSANKLLYKEAPVKTINIDKAEGMKILDGLKAIILMLKWKFKF